MNYRMDSLTEAKITKILDGDTLKVTLPNGFIITVRLLLIDSPEYKRAIIDQQLYGYEATEFARNNLKIGDRLITVNQYWPKMMFDYAPDLIPGENSSNQFRDVIPVVGLFVAENEGVCIRKVETIEISEWHKLQELTLKYLQEKPDTYRDGFRYFKTK